MTLLVAAATTLLLAATGCAGDRTGRTEAGDSFPSKDIRLIVQAAAGGASDLTARALAKEMEASLGRSIVVENRPGASGSTALKFVASQPADGYTIGYMPVEISMLDHRGFGVKPADFTLLGQVVTVPAAIAVKADSPYQTLAELIEGAKAKPAAVTVANSGPGSIWEAATSALGQAAGVTFKPVPFDGGAPAVAAAVGGKVEAVAAGVSEVAPKVKEGQLRVLAVLDQQRAESLPDVPTTAELGHPLEVGGWGGIGAPKGLPDAVTKKLTEAVEKAAQSQAFTDILRKAGAVPRYLDPGAFTSFAGDEYERFRPLLKAGS